MTIESTESGIENAAPEGSESPSAVTPASETAPVEAAASENAPTQHVPPAYTPNLKFKYWDTKENAQVEKEFDEWAKALAKDEKMEKLLRDHHEKVYGHDALKSSRERYATEYGNAAQQVTQYEQVFQNVGQCLERDQSGTPRDLDSVLFGTLKLTEDDILKHAVKICDRRENPAKAEAFTQNQQYSQQYNGLQNQYNQLQQNFMQVADRARTTEMSYVMQRPDITEAKQQFDQVRGPGAFERAVIERGKYHYAVNRQDISAEQAVNEVLSYMMHNPAAQGGNPGQQAVNGGQQTAPPVLPNIRGKGTSPAKKVPKSIDDLRSLAKEMQANS